MRNGSHFSARDDKNNHLVNTLTSRMKSLFISDALTSLPKMAILSYFKPVTSSFKKPALPR